VEEQALISANNKNLGIMVRGVGGDTTTGKHTLHNHLIAGAFDQDNPETLVIGKQLADKLYISVDQQIKLLSPSGKISVLGNIPNSKNFKLSGIFDVGMSNYNNDFAFINIATAQKLFKLDNSVSYIEIYAKNPGQSEILMNKIKSKIGSEYLVTDWKHKNATFFNALKTERVAMFTILTLIIMVASFNIISSLTMLVKDKTADIAILRTMGATKRDIILIFTIIGIAIGIIGTLLGAAIGISFALNVDNIKTGLESLSGMSLFDPLVYFLSFMPSKIEYADVAKICCMSIGLSILSTIYPALKASKLEPVEALRYT
jgi:lipoprotein-releasing system permease protein